MTEEQAGETGREAEAARSEEQPYALDAALVAEVLEALEAGERERVLALIEPLHEADLADLFEQIAPAERDALTQALGGDIDPDVLIELEEGVRDEVLASMNPDDLAAAVKELETDDVVYLVEDLEDAAQEKVLEALEPSDRIAVQSSLQYPEDSAGRLMQREIVVAPTFWNVGQIIDHMRASEDLPERFHDIVLVDPSMKPVAQVALSRVMGSPRATPLTEIADEDMRVIPVDQTEADVAYAFNQYHLISAPVIDGDGRLVGVITIDDAMEVLDDEAEEDLKLLAGVGDEELSDSVSETVRLRFVWLAVNLVTAILASLVISIFDRTIEAIVALAVLMPIVASMGGNGGTQTLTVVVRALATRDITSANAWRIIRREALVGLFNGMAFAIIISGIALAWYGDLALGAVLALAMVVNMVAAGLAGVLIPMGLEKVGADPALASGTFVTTVTDVVGFFAFLGLASMMLL